MQPFVDKVVFIASQLIREVSIREQIVALSSRYMEILNWSYLQPMDVDCARMGKAFAVKCGWL